METNVAAAVAAGTVAAAERVVSRQNHWVVRGVARLDRASHYFQDCWVHCRTGQEAGISGCKNLPVQWTLASETRWLLLWGLLRVSCVLSGAGKLSQRLAGGYSNSNIGRGLGVGWLLLLLPREEGHSTSPIENGRYG